MNHNKDKTNISRTSHVSLWGLPACLCTAFIKGSHLLLFPLSSKWNKAFVCSLEQKPLKSYGRHTETSYFCGLDECSLTEHLDVNVLSFSHSGSMCVFELWFWWKTPESEDSLISHTPNEGVWTTSFHYWKRKRLTVWATSKNEGWFTFFVTSLCFLVLHFTPTEDFPHNAISFTFFSCVL